MKKVLKLSLFIAMLLLSIACSGGAKKLGAQVIAEGTQAVTVSL